MENLWYLESQTSLFKSLKTKENGLSKLEVQKRLKRYGLNEIKQVAGVKWYALLFHQFTDLMVLILISAMVVSALAGEEIEAIAIGVIILINAGIGFSQEFKAERAVEALKEMAAPSALVIRDKQSFKIPANELVPGDIIILEEGMRIPADARLISMAQLECIEASLTGESHPSKKHTEAIKSKGKIPLGDRQNMVFMGTVIGQGHGKAVVVETGMKTQFGKIAHLVQSEKRDATPMQKQLHKLSKILAGIVFGIIGFLVLYAVLTGGDLMEVFLLSISLAVSVIPEGLPAIITLTLALAVQRMAKKGAIIRKLAAAETLGSTSVICSDKTGTLTQNQMTIEKLVMGEMELTISGVGYEPKGEILERDTLSKTQEKDLQILIKSAALCNNSKLLKNPKGKKAWDISGDPTEACMLTLAVKSGLNIQDLNKGWSRENELVFDSERKRMSTLDLDLKNKKHTLHTKGAPDAIIEVSSHILVNGKITPFTPSLKRKWLKKNENLAGQAYRVLAIAQKGMSTKEANEKLHTEEEKGLTFLGLMAMMDPPREEVKEAIETCHNANIQVKMITGDHALTAQAIGRKIGLFKDGDLLVTGAELEKMSTRKLRSIVKKTTIFARVSPHHKVKIVKALKDNGQVVAMTGDGVNDAPALKRADIGVAMGITGTDVSKEASEMILTDDNFATIVETVREGRVIYRNIKKFIRFLLSANFCELLIVSIVFLMGYPLAILPLQILWINLLTDAFPAIALGLDPADEDIMKLKPRDPKQSIWKDLVGVGMLVGTLGTAVSLILYFKNYEVMAIEHIRTLVFTSIVIFELLQVFSLRSKHKHYFHHFFKNKFLLVSVLISLLLQLLAIYWAPLQNILKTVPLDVTDWTWILGLSVAATLIVEIWKKTQKAPTHV
jgi:Ca2+-transporting ATPase